ncbi:MAG: glycosyltransferase [Selenomonadaceae bacterium]|nr:glycosyltransferase [Selenomonadaceae bacterium]
MSRNKSKRKIPPILFRKNTPKLKLPTLPKVEEKKPKVSVILSSYNHAKYVATAIESVLHQTFTDFELLIYDDGSTDNSREIIKTFDDPRVKTFLYEENRGPRIAAIEAFNAVQGKYIAVHHSDDVWKEDKLQKQVEFLDNNAEYVACFTWAEFIDEDGMLYEVSDYDLYHNVFKQRNRSREQWLHDLFFKGNCFCHPSVLLRNTKFLQEVYKISGLWQLIDYAMWIRLLLQYNVYVIEDKLTFFRLRRFTNDNTSAERPDTVIRSELELYRILQEYRRITDAKEFLKVFPEAQPYVIEGNILPQYALAKILQSSSSAARKLLALDILFDLLNDKNTAQKLIDWYKYDEKSFVHDNAEAGIIYTLTNIRYLRTSLYYDTGLGFSEQNRIRVLAYVRQDGIFTSEFFVNANEIVALRFDPSENESLAMKIISAQVNDESVDMTALPPFKEIDENQIFLTQDPQYMVKYSGNGNIRVKIIGEISRTYDPFQILRDENISLLEDKYNLIQSLNLQNQKLDQATAEFSKINILEEQIETDNQIIDNLQNVLNLNLQKVEELKGQVNSAQQQFDGLQSHLNEIYSSRGYRFLQKYYGLRDKLLPKGTTRRLFVKNLAWVLFNPRRALSLINSENIGKLISTFRHGGLRQVMIRSDNKLNSPAVTEIEKFNEIVYGNAWLDEKIPYTVPRDIVVDIIVPIYNAVDFTRRCLETVFENTDVKFNLYLINDCSPDERINSLLIDVAFWKRPKLLLNLDISHNEENLGFIGTVNRGLKMTRNHVVLLNTDTEVPPNWLSRLIRPMLEDEKVASVTPFSNSAEICSFPNICTNNDLPKNLTVTELDSLFARYGDKTFCDMPTGIGFCMLMRRECIKQFGGFDTIFGKGYGEENDWCRRTAAQGYHHVHVRNLFVYHKHGASFAERVDKSKKQRIQENLAIINERYPGYDKIIQDYIHADPAGANRKFLYHCVQAQSDVKGVMFLNHSMGGGATTYQNRIIAKLKENWRVYGMEPLADRKTLLVKSYNDNDEEKVADFNIDEMNAEEFKELLHALNIDWLYVNQLVTYPIPKILQWIIQSEIPYTFFGHDFFAVCPRCHFLTESMEYCGAETNLNKCAACLKRSSIDSVNSVDISKWRKNFQEFIFNAKEVIVPSDNTAEIFRHYYPSISITVREHEVNDNLTYTFREEFAREEILNVAIIGAIGIEKGSRIIYDLANDLEKISLPVKLTVIGITNLHNNAYRSESRKFEITGAYDNNKISDLLSVHKIAVVIVTSIIPETYSYTTTEAMYSGYPVMVFPIGAPADRVKRTGGGWILDEISEQAVLNKLKELVNDREEIISAAKKLTH